MPLHVLSSVKNSRAVNETPYQNCGMSLAMCVFSWVRCGWRCHAELQHVITSSATTLLLT